MHRWSETAGAGYRYDISILRVQPHSLGEGHLSLSPRWAMPRLLRLRLRTSGRADVQFRLPHCNDLLEQVLFGAVRGEGRRSDHG